MTFVTKREKNQLNTKIFEDNFPVEKIYGMRDFKESPRDVSYNQKFIRTFVLEGMPKNIDPGDLNSILSFTTNDRYTIKTLIVPQNIPILKRKFTFARTFYSAMANVTGIFMKRSEMGIAKKVNDLNNFEAQMYGGSDIAKISLSISFYASSKEELNDIERRIQARFVLEDWNFVTPLYNQKKTFLDNLPVATPIQDNGMIITTQQLSVLNVGTTMPNFDKGGKESSFGYLIGSDLAANIPYFFPYFKGDRVYNITVTGKNGSGKSSLLKKMFEELNLFSIQRLVIDPEGEYVDVANHIGARVIELNRGSGINPMYFNEGVRDALDDFDKETINLKNDHILNLVSFFTLFPFVPKEHKESNQLILKSLTDFYDLAEPDDRYIEKYCDFLDANRYEFDFADAFSNFRPAMPYGGFFSSREPLSMEEEAIVFNLKGVEDSHTKLAMMYIIMTQVKDKMLLNNTLKDSRAKVVTTFVDEFHLFLKDGAVKDRFVEISKRNRKYNCNFILSTQEITDFSKYKADSLIEQAGFNIVFRQDERAGGLLRFTSEQMRELIRLPIGTCYVINPNGIDGSLNKVKIYLSSKQEKYVSKKNSVI